MKRSINPESLSFHFSSVKKLPDDELVAAPLGKGVVYKIERSDDWVEMSEGLTEKMNINRLQSYGKSIYACTNKGLFLNDDGIWKQAGLSVGCYQIREFGGIAMAGTACGLWVREHKEWRAMMRTDVVVYDFMYFPQYVVLATNEGLSILDRFTQSWIHENHGFAVTSLAVHRGAVVGATEQGHLIVGNRRGGFDRFRIANAFIFSVVPRGAELFACTDRGLYRFGSIGERTALLALKLGCQVTDVDADEEHYYLATLFEGVLRAPR